MFSPIDSGDEFDIDHCFDMTLRSCDDVEALFARAGSPDTTPSMPEPEPSAHTAASESFIAASGELDPLAGHREVQKQSEAQSSEAFVQPPAKRPKCTTPAKMLGAKWDVSSSSGGEDDGEDARSETLSVRSIPQTPRSKPGVFSKVTPTKMGQAVLSGALMVSQQEPTVLPGCSWWQPRVLEALQPVRAQLKASLSKPYTTEHLCAGTGADFLAFEAEHLNTGMCA